MKLFKSKNLFEAMDYVKAGGQALHVWKPPENAYSEAPVCFKKTKLWGHLLDNNLARLTATARNLGVKVIKVSKQGQRGQHIDLCGKPLQKAIGEAEK